MSSYKDLETGGTRQLGAIANETVGSFFITIALMAGVSGWGALAAAGMVAYFTWFEPSGQYNAAVTLSQSASSNNRAMALVAGLKCIAAQIVGAALAVLFSGVFTGGSASVPAGSLSSGLGDVVLTLVLLYTFDLGVEKPRSGLDVGLAFFSGLSAFGSALGANPSVVLGVCLGNAVLGNGLNLGMDLAWAVGAPALAGAAFPYLSDVLLKIPRVNELVGTFLFAVLAFSIGFDSAFAVGVSLHAVSNIFPGTYNPALSLAAWAKGGFEMSVIGDPILDILAQTAGCALAAIVSSIIGTDGAIPAAAELGMPAVFEATFAVVLAFVYLAKAENLTNGVAYVAIVTASASSVNPAFGLGLYVAGLAGFGRASLALTAILDPMLAGVVAGVAHGKLDQLNELVGTLLLLLFAGATSAGGGGASNGLALGAAFVALHTIYADATFNPAITLAKSGVELNTKLLQVGGAAIGGLLATYGGIGGELASPGGLSDGGRSLVAEVLLAALLAKTYEANGADHLSTGLSYYALLAALGAAAGSLANPALVLGCWLGNGLLGTGFDFGLDALLGLLGHLAAPLLGARFYREIFALPDQLMLSKAGLQADELFGSFLAVLAAAGVAQAASIGDSAALAYALMLMSIYNIYSSATDIFPAVSAYRTLRRGDDPVKGLVAFAQKLVAQTLGAILAALLAGWLFADDGRRLLAEPHTAPHHAKTPTAHASLARRLGVGLPLDLPDGLLNGLLAALLFAWACDVARSTLNLGVAYFTMVSVFSDVTINGAASLATALVGLVTGGGADFATDLVWWTAFLAPIIGGVLAALLAPLVGK